MPKLRVHVDHRDHEIRIVVPRPVPEGEFARQSLHRLVDLAMDHLQAYPGRDTDLFPDTEGTAEPAPDLRSCGAPIEG